MALIQLKISNLRIIQEADLSLGKNLNVIYGLNASGKTSVLEAIYLLGLGRSFRSSKLDDLPRKGETEGLAVFGQTEVGGKKIKLGFGRRAGESRYQLDKQACSRRDLAEGLAIQSASPESHYSFLHSARERRSLLDWIVFHVEPDFYDCWQNYQRALKQRNALLRGTNTARTEFGPWNAQLSDSGEKIHNLRQKYIYELQVKTEDILFKILQDHTAETVSLRLRRGWAKDLALADILARDLVQEMEKGYTQAGPHRADLQLLFNKETPLQSASHGQQKLLVLALRLAATRIVKAIKPSTPIILLLDDIAAELDQGNLERVLNQLSGLEIQVVATTPTPGALAPEIISGANLFHVEQGRIRPV